MTRIAVTVIAGFISIGVSACAGNPVGPSPTQQSAPSMAISAELEPVVAFLEADTWRHPLLQESMITWVRRHVKEIAVEELGSGAYAGVNDLNRPRIAFNVRYVHDLSIELKAGLLLHEARHLELQRGHTCPNGWADATMEEGGAIAVHVLYLEHVGIPTAAEWYRRFAIGC